VTPVEKLKSEAEIVN